MEVLCTSPPPHSVGFNYVAFIIIAIRVRMIAPPNSSQIKASLQENWSVSIKEPWGHLQCIKIMSLFFVCILCLFGAWPFFNSTSQQTTHDYLFHYLGQYFDTCPSPSPILTAAPGFCQCHYTALINATGNRLRDAPHLEYHQQEELCEVARNPG